MSSISKKLIYEEYFNDNETIPYKIEIYKIDKKKEKDESNNWKGVLLFLALIALFAIFISSIFLLNWRRPGLYLEDCKDRSCAPGFDLKCINSICQCPSSDFYYTNKCYQKKSYGEFCHNSQEQCKQGLICYNGKCSCEKTKFWSGIKCVDRVNYGENCDFNKCLDSLFLVCDASINLCVCDSTRFWSGKACYKKRLYDEICASVSDACRSDLGLICLNGFCTCNETTTIYNSSTLSCLPKKSFMETCFNTSECSQLQGLYCSSSGVCDCINTTITYFDTNALSCIPKKNETETCNTSVLCLGDMLCLNDSCKCSNLSTQYFDSSQMTCLNKTLKGVSCARNITCRSDLALSCMNDSCQCDSRTSYWSSIRLVCVECPSGWTIFQDKCYFMFNNLTTWANAQSMCQSTGGNLVSIRTQTDYLMVSGYYNQYTNYGKLWVGAQQNITYNFYWRDGFTKMNKTYPNSNWWCPTNPNNSPLNSPTGVTNIRQGCVRMQKWPSNCNDVSIICTSDICLNDEDCNGLHAYLCERE